MIPSEEPVVKSVGTIATANGSKYLQQLCKHWAHSLETSFDATRGTVTFPAVMRDKAFPAPARCTMLATSGTLSIELDAANEEQIELLQLVLVSHLDRFAFREAPLAVTWSHNSGDTISNSS